MSELIFTDSPWLGDVLSEQVILNGFELMLEQRLPEKGICFEDAVMVSHHIDIEAHEAVVDYLVDGEPFHVVAIEWDEADGDPALLVEIRRGESEPLETEEDEE